MSTDADAKLTTGWKLWRASLAELKSHWRVYIGLVLVVELPLRLLGLSANVTQDATFVSYSSILTLVLDLALLSLVLAFTGNHKMTLREAYYDGTAAFVRYALTVVSFALLIALPAALAALVLYIGVLTAGSPAESWIFVLLGVALGLPVLLLFSRLGFGVITVVRDHARPWAALRWSWNITRGQLWRLAGRYLVLIAWVMATALVLAIPVIILGLVIRSENALNDIYQFLATTILLPVGTIYFVKLFRSLEGLPGKHE